MSAETEIFTSDATGTPRSWDPERVYRRLVHATSGLLGKVFVDSRAAGEDDGEDDSEEVLQQKALSRMQADAKAFPATEKLLAATSYAFEVQPYDPVKRQGVTERRLKTLLDDFWDWCESVKKNTEPSVTSPEPTALPASSDAPPATKKSSDCGCSSTASTTAAPPR